jgi:hypothetical protein
MNPGNGVTMLVVAKNLTFGTDLGSRCTKLADNRATCRLTGSPTDSIEFIAEPPRGEGASMTFTIIPDDGTPNDDLTNDQATVELAARKDVQAPPASPTAQRTGSGAAF